ncbi:MAG: hypothetical protein ACREN2_03605 [Candidatus Dormibacteria bacterium]
MPQQVADAAQPLPAATDWSWYVTHNNDDYSSMRALGCNEGTARRTDNSNSELVLDFGSQDPNGGQTYLPFHDVFLSYTTIIGDSEWFAIGYFECVGRGGTNYLKLGIGTSNDNVQGQYSDPTNAYYAGVTWTQIATDVYNFVASQQMTGRVAVYGASDMETGYGSQNATLNWVQGFATGSLAFLDYGDAGGCPRNSYTSGDGYGCNGDWNQYGVWYKSWGNPAAYPLPEIYYQPLADQWWTISRYGYYDQGGARLTFEGPLDEYDRDPSTNTNVQAWNDLSNDLENDANTNVPLTYSVEIH